MTKRSWILVALGVGVLVLGLGAWLFEPWRLFTSSTVDEAVPTVAVTPAPSGTPSATASDRVLSEGEFVDGELFVGACRHSHGQYRTLPLR